MCRAISLAGVRRYIGPLTTVAVLQIDASEVDDGSSRDLLSQGEAFGELVDGCPKV